jgi:hypothetical protein
VRIRAIRCWLQERHVASVPDAVELLTGKNGTMQYDMKFTAGE